MYKFLVFSFFLLSAINAISQVYVVENNLVYFHDKVIEGADADSFDVFYQKTNYAKDKNAVYFKGRRTTYDVNSFVIHEAKNSIREYFSDKNDIYLYNYDVKSYLPIGSSSPNYFSFENENIATDKNSIFWNGIKLPNSDSNSLEIISKEIFRDKRHVYIKNYTLPINIEQMRFFIDDNNRIKYIGDQTKICSEYGACYTMNIEAFQQLTYSYVKDTRKVLYQNRYLNADAKTFNIPKPKMDNYAKDKNVEFYAGNAFPIQIPEKHLVNSTTLQKYYNRLKKKLNSAFTNSKTKKENTDKLPTIYTFPNSENTTIKKGKNVYMNDELLSFIDAASFVIFNNDYAKDKNHVYLIYESSKSVSFNSIKNADPNTFKIIENDFDAYCSDKNSVFHHLNTIETADPTTFKVINKTISKDKNTLFFNGKKLKNIKPSHNNTFQKIDKRYYRYGNKICYISYDGDNTLVGDQFDQFKVLNYYYALNNKNLIYKGKRIGILENNEVISEVKGHYLITSNNTIYYYGNKIELEKSNWLRKLGNTSYLTDGELIYTNTMQKLPNVKLTSLLTTIGYNEYLVFNNGTAIYNDTLINVDIETFEQFRLYYAKDKNHVYYRGEKTNLDSKTFFKYDGNFTSDKNGVYYYNSLIPEADPETFNVFYEYGFDKTNFYYRGKIIPRSAINLRD